MSHFTDPEIARNTLAIPFPYTEADADWWLEHCEREVPKAEMRLAIRDSSGYLIGAIGIIGGPSTSSSTAELGYWLGKAYRGRGIMPRVLECFAEYAFRDLGFHQVFAMPFGSNTASHRALEKAGFQHEGVLREHYCKDGVYLDAVVYGLLAGESTTRDGRNCHR